MWEGAWYCLIVVLPLADLLSLPWLFFPLFTDTDLSPSLEQSCSASPGCSASPTFLLPLPSASFLFLSWYVLDLCFSGLSDRLPPSEFHFPQPVMTSNQVKGTSLPHKMITLSPFRQPNSFSLEGMACPWYSFYKACPSLELSM